LKELNNIPAIDLEARKRRGHGSARRPFGNDRSRVGFYTGPPPASVDLSGSQSRRADRYLRLLTSGYLLAGFSKWPPNWKRIAESSLFW
jgi:hypothetical protein